MMARFSTRSHGVVSQGSSLDLAARLFGGTGGGGPAVSATNPTQLDAGHYDSVTIDEGHSSNFDSDGGVYVIKDLLVKDSGHSIFWTTASR